MSNNRLSIVGIPFHGGQPKKGVDMGPAGLRQAGIVQTVQGAGWKVVSDDDVNVIERMETTVGRLKDPHWVGNVCKHISEHCSEKASQCDFLLSLGGDHSIAVGTIASALKKRPDAFVVWVDAHADINTPDTSDSGNLHGMPVAFLAKVAGDVEGFEWLSALPTLDLKRIVYVGLRDVDVGEKVLLKEKGIKHYNAEDVHQRGIQAVTEEVLAYVKGAPVHLSFDIDALDPIHAPATGTPVHSGLSLEDGKYLCTKLAETGRVVSMDMVEVNPSLSDDAGATLTHAAAIELVRCTLRRPE